jgi:hypothetical protein
MINKKIDIGIDFKRMMEKRQRLLHIKLRDYRQSKWK